MRLRKVWVVIVIACVALSLAAPLSAADPVLRIDWAKLKADGKLLAGTVVEGASVEGASGVDGAVLRVKNGSISIPTKVMLVEIDQPPLKTQAWHVAGLIRYQDIKGTGFLELVSNLPKEQLTSKTFAESGARGKLTGTSGWRAVWLPVDAKAQGQKPSKLLLRVNLPPEASVEIGPLALYEGFGDEASVTPGAWWGQRTSNMMFGLIGVVVVLIAPLLGFAARRRKAKLAVMTTYRAMLGLCGAGLLGGIVAAATGQPYTVYFPLLLLGLIGGGVFGMNYRKMGASYEEPPEAVIEA